MVFYQADTPTVSLNMLTDAIMKGTPASAVMDLHFCRYSDVLTLKDAVSVIDAKRQTLPNPMHHSFLVIELPMFNNLPPDSAIHVTRNLAESINTYFDNHLFVISLVYSDNSDKTHSLVILSDMESSLSESAKKQLTAETLYDAISSALPDSAIESIMYDTLYLFHHPDSALEYGGVIHLKCNDYNI